MVFKGTTKIEAEEEWYVATGLENSIVSQGKTIDAAAANLREAIALCHEDAQVPVTSASAIYM